MSFPISNNHAVQTPGSIVSDTVINEWLDRWDETWQPGIEHLKAIAAESGFLAETQLAELIRVDIDRRYRIDNSLPIAEYFHTFPNLFSNTAALASIAFEDYRARRSAGLDCPRSRWAWVPGVNEQAWFIELSEQPQPSETPGEPEVGREFGEFRLVSLLGEGAFSQVYLATQRMLGDRYVALKVVRRTLSEPYHLARLHHTGIVPLFSLHRIGEYSALCMPYSGAATLADWLNAAHDSSDRAALKSLRTGQSLIDTVVKTQARLNAQTLRDRPQPSPSSSAEDTVPPAEGTGRESSLSLRPLDLLASMEGPELTLWLACRLASALAHAHVRGIAHGDLKPANILLRNDGEPSLIDFNLARAEDNQDQQWIGGTLPYMAPEQMRAIIGRGCLLTFASDVYALGMILYEILEGKLPYPAAISLAEVDLDRAIADRQSSTLHFSVRSGLSGIHAIIRKCLAFDPVDRYANGEQLLEDLECERQHLPLKHAQEPLKHRLRKLGKRHPIALSNSVFIGAAVAISLTALLIGWAGWQRSQTAAAREALSGLIVSSQTEHSQLLDTPARAVPNRTSRWLQLANTKLQLDAGQLDDSPIVSRLPAQERDTLMRMLFEQSLALTWLTAERATYGADSISISEARLIDLMKLLSQFQGHAQSPLYQALADWLRPGSVSTSESIVTIARTLQDEGRLSSAELSVTEKIIWARLLTMAGESAAALEHLASVRDARVSRFLYWDTCGKAHSQAGQHALARQSFLLAIESEPNSASSYGQCAAARLAMGDRHGAEADLNLAIELSADPTGPAVSELLIQRAMVREQLNKLQLAIEDTNRALGLKHETCRLFNLRSRLARKMGNSQQAKADLEAGLNAEPKSVSDWNSRGLARASQEPEKALEDFQHALSLNPRSVSALQNMAYVQTDYLHDEASAIKSLDRIIQIQPDHEGARGGRAVLLARLGKADLAKADIRYLEQHVALLQPATIYQFGCAHALLVKQHPESFSKAMNYLLKSLSSYGANVIANDPDLDLLRDKPAFQSLLELSKALTKP